ncbi:MAG: hypothetical protein AB7G80_09300 [Dongiaceae bacterium]
MQRSQVKPSAPPLRPRPAFLDLPPLANKIVWQEYGGDFYCYRLWENLERRGWNNQQGYERLAISLEFLAAELGVKTSISASSIYHLRYGRWGVRKELKTVLDFVMAAPIGLSVAQTMRWVISNHIPTSSLAQEYQRPAQRPYIHKPGRAASLAAQAGAAPEELTKPKPLPEKPRFTFHPADPVVIKAAKDRAHSRAA